jgi:hypothetical protein
MIKKLQVQVTLLNVYVTVLFCSEDIGGKKTHLRQAILPQKLIHA